MSHDASDQAQYNRLARRAVFRDAFRVTLKMKHLMGVDSGCAVSSVVEHFLDTVGVGSAQTIGLQDRPGRVNSGSDFCSDFGCFWPCQPTANGQSFPLVEVAKDYEK